MAITPDFVMTIGGRQVTDKLMSWVLSHDDDSTGFVVRAVFIFMGLALIILTALASICALVLWLVLPLTIIFIFVLGIILLFK